MATVTAVLAATMPAARPVSVAPSWPGDFPDPYVVRIDGTYWAYATQTTLGRVPAMRSTDLLVWQPAGDAMPALPSWAADAGAWAPAALVQRNRVVLYSALVVRNRQGASGIPLRCIAALVATAPQGPFVDPSHGPIVCQPEHNGSIDPSVFVAPGGRPYLLWKSEGIPRREPPYLWVQELSADGLSVRGKPVALVRADRSWEYPVIENPAMAASGGRFFLFYSGNRWDSTAYAIGYAVCATVTGPCVKPADNRLITSDGSAAGPGGLEVFTDTAGVRRLAYHAWTPGNVGYPAGQRSLRLRSLEFRAHGPVAID